MIEKLKLAWDTYHPRSFTVSLRKQNPEVYDWVLAQPDIIPTKSFADKVFTLLSPIPPICANNNCENQVSILNRAGWSLYCSGKCKGQHNSLKSREKAVATSNKNWGVDNPAQHESIRAAMRSTMKINHGVEYAKQSPLILSNTENTMLERYNVKYAAQSPAIQEKIKLYWLEKYGVDNPAKRHISQDTYDKLNNPEWLAEQNKLYSFEPMAEQLGISIPTLSGAFKKHGLKAVQHNIIISSAEHDIVNFIRSRSNTLVIESDRTIIAPYEIDIFLPELKVAIEFNGNYWHSELNGKDSKYHLSKTNECAKKGIQLIHLWEYIYNQKSSIVYSKLNNILGNSISIYGRQCIIKEVDIDVAKEFLDKTHLQGYCASTYRIGLWHKEELAAVMTFGKTRFSHSYEYELLRYSSKLGHNVIGGFSKLLAHFIKTYNPTSIVSYSDLTWSIGNVYKKNGFNFSHRADPSYYYTGDYVNFEHRMAWQKKKMPDKLPNFNIDLSEWENMKNHGYDRIWNCGNDVWIWNKQ